MFGSFGPNREDIKGEERIRIEAVEELEEEKRIEEEQCSNFTNCQINIDDLVGDWYGYPTELNEDIDLEEDRWSILEIVKDSTFVIGDGYYVGHSEYPAPFYSKMIFKYSKSKEFLNLYHYEESGQSSQHNSLLQYDYKCRGKKVGELKLIHNNLLEFKLTEKNECFTSFTSYFIRSNIDECCRDSSLLNRYNRIIGESQQHPFQGQRILINLLKKHGVSLSLYNNNLIDIKDIETRNNITFSKTTNEKITGIVYDLYGIDQLADVDILRYQCYFNGKLNGISFFGGYCYEDGDCTDNIIETYSNGLKNGISSHYWYGYYAFKGLYINGKPDGLHEYWYIQSDKKEKEIYFNLGVVIKQKCWDEDGNLMECQ